MSRRQVVMPIDGRLDARSARLRGGKGAHLADMHALGLPVPPGFTVTTTVARAFMEHDRLPKRLGRQIERELVQLEKKTGKRYGDPQNPLLLSVRSGAEVSMPGMMDTVLNLGMNEEIRSGLAARTNEAFANDCYERFLQGATGSMPAWVRPMFSGCIDLISPREQLGQAIASVLRSWNSERAVAYRAACGIPDTLGTAVTVQAMVFGNRDERSGTGVVFSRNPVTGERMLFGEFLPMAQGEDVVSGSCDPMPIEALREWNPELYEELVGYTLRIEEHLGAIADIEFTIESGKLYLLQCRAAKVAAEAAATFAVHQQWEKRWSKERAVNAVTHEQRAMLSGRASLVLETRRDLAKRWGRGLAASPGAAYGVVASTSEEAQVMKAKGRRVVLVRPETTPDDLPGMLVADAIITAVGGATCHAAVVARQLGIPAVVGAGDVAKNIIDAASHLRERETPLWVSVDGTSGNVYEGVIPMTSPTHAKEVNIFRKWVVEMKPAPRIAFEAVKQKIHVSSLCMHAYLLESMANAARGSSLENELVRARDEVHVGTAEIFACYLAIAVASELRWAWQKVTCLKISDRDLLSSKYHITESYDRGDEEILSVLKALDSSEHTAFFAFAEHVFRDYRWGSPSYGGAKWADIARAGHLFLSGKLTHGTFVDHVFDLRHNGGVLFDKHDMMRSEGDMQEILESKKYLSLSEFFWKCSEYYSLDHLIVPSVLGLWKQGLKANLWKEKVR